MENSKSNTKKSKYLKWRKRILVLLLVIILVPTTLFTIGWLNRDTVIEVIQNWYDDNNSGTLTIGKIDASFISNFPNVGFTLKDIKQTHRDTVSDKISSVEINQVNLVIGAGKLLRGDIKFKKIAISDAVVRSKVVSDKSLAFHENLKREKQSQEQKGIQMPEWLDEDGVTFTLKSVKFIKKYSILNKNFNLNIKSIDGVYKKKKRQLNGHLAMDITVNQMGFNTEKGSYFNGAQVSGNPNFTIDLESNTISVPEFLFKIDKQNFNLSADFDLSDSSAYHFKLSNPNTDFNALKSLLPDNISTKIKKFKFNEPIKTNLSLSGEFAYGNNPKIEVDFSTDENSVKIGEKLNLTNVVLNGYLTNDIYKTDSLKTALKSKKDLKITFNTINAEIDDIKVDINDAYFQSTPKALNFVQADISLEGSNEALVQLIETENFDFKGGTFQLNAAISGDVPNAYQFVNKSTGNFNLKNTQVVLKENGLQLPIETIDLELKRENSRLQKLVINLPNGENLVLKGQLKNSAALISKNPDTPTTSNISLNSERLNVNDIISLSKKFLPINKKNINNRKNLHQTLTTIYNQFQPSFNINVNALTYNNVTINNLKSEIDLTDPETIKLKQFNFNYDNTLTHLEGTVKVPKPKSEFAEAIYINAEATSKGSISVFKELFNISLFRINSGDYQFSGTVNGNVKKITELLNNTKGNLTLSNTKLYYPPADINVEIDSIALNVGKADMYLNKFNLEVGELYPLKLTGNIKHFPNFLLDEIDESGSIFLKIDAPSINANKMMATINSLKNDEQFKEPKNKNPLYQLFKDVNKFNPKVELKIDSLKYQNLITENVEALAYFENDSILKLNNLNLNYNESTATINGKINAHNGRLDSLKNNPFDLDFYIDVKGKSKDLNAYLKTKNFIFESGDFDFKGEYKAQADNLNIINAKSYGELKISNTLVDYKAAALSIPVDSLHVEINNDLATLKTLDINLPNKSEVFFSGYIDQFSDFINNTQNGTARSSNFSIYSPYLDTVDVLTFLASASSGKEKSSDKKEFSLQQFKEAMVGINTSFYPTANVKIDTLKNDNLTITDLGLNFLFDENGNFKMKDTHLEFYGGTLDINTDIDINNKNNLPAKITMQAKNINLNELAKRFNYFDDDALRQADTIEGNLNINLKSSGTLTNNGKLNLSSLNGIVELEISDLKLYNYKPIMENSVLMKDERFEKLKFRPIVQTFNIVNGELIIPRTEIQSSALHLFVEGIIKFDDYVNVWLSLPWKNLKSKDGLTLPEKTTYDEAGSKFHVQLIQDKTAKKKKNRELKVKFRLSNRKLRKMKEVRSKK